MTARSLTELNIDEKAYSYARIYSSLLKDEYQRKRAYASLVALYALINSLEKTDLEIQKSMTLFRNPVLNEQYEISDVYVNNWHIDVRVVTEGDGFLVPKSHYDSDIVPDFYAVVKVDKSLKHAELVGFADTLQAVKYAFDYNYYSISLDSLISYDEFISKVQNPKLVDFSPKEHDLFRESYLSIMDEETDAQTKNKVIKHLFECAQCRTEFCCFTGFEMVSCNMSAYENLFEDMTLNIIGAQDADNAKYAGKEETIYIGNDEEESDNKHQELSEESEQDTSSETDDREATVSDILDELFNIEEDAIEPEIPEEKPLDVQPAAEDDASEGLVIIEDDGEEKYDNSEDSDSTLEIMQDSDDNKYQNNELEVIGAGTIDEIESSSDDVELIDTDKDDEAENDLEIHSEDNDELEILEDAEAIVENTSVEAENTVQKVIVDYDEFGEPVYSYITNVNQDEESPDIQYDSSDDDILNEEFETYPQVNDDEASDLININNGSARPIEYVQQDDSQDDISEVSETEETELVFNDKEEDSSEPEPYPEEESEESFEEYKDEDESDIQYNEDSNENLMDDILDNDDDSADEEEYEQYEEYSDEEQADDENIEDFQETANAEYEGEAETEEYEYEENDEPVSGKKSSPILAVLILLIFAACGAGAFLFLKNKEQTQTIVDSSQNTVEAPSVSQSESDLFETADGEGIDIPSGSTEGQNDDSSMLPPPPVNAEAQNGSSTGTINIPPLTEKDLLKNQNTSTSDVNKAIVNAFSKGGNSVTLRGVNWLCSPQLFTDSTFKSYMQKLDNILKLNLRKNILDITEPLQNDSVTVKMAIDNNGNLNKVAISESSGSEQADKIVLQSINETFEGEKSQILNDSALKSDMYYLKVVIKL